MATLKEELKKTPGKGRIHMPGSFFKVLNEEMKSSHSYTVYGTKLRNGVPIPLFVKLWLKGKEGGKKRSPQAVAGTRILWDALPEDEASLDANLSDRGMHEQAKKFVKKVALYKKDKTDPPGATAHWELGGIRCVPRSRVYRLHFEKLGGWGAKAPVKRGWAGYSVCAKAGSTSADSGLLYYNGRIAGDRHHVTAYVDLESTLDERNPKIAGVPAERISQSILLQNWREVLQAKSFIVGSETVPLDFEEANVEFKKSALSIVTKPGTFREEIQEKWKQSYRNLLSAPGVWPFAKDAAESDPGIYPASFISFADYWEKTNPDVGFVSKVWHRVKVFFGAASDPDYIRKCDASAYYIYTRVAQAFQLGPYGLSCFKFKNSGEHNLQKDYFTLGVAPFIDGFSTVDRAILFVFQKARRLKP